MFPVGEETAVEVVNAFLRKEHGVNQDQLGHKGIMDHQGYKVFLDYKDAKVIKENGEPQE